jgi:hypothetical protein
VKLESPSFEHSPPFWHGSDTQGYSKIDHAFCIQIKSTLQSIQFSIRQIYFLHKMWLNIDITDDHTEARLLSTLQERFISVFFNDGFHREYKKLNRWLLTEAVEDVQSWKCPLSHTAMKKLEYFFFETMFFPVLNNPFLPFCGFFHISYVFCIECNV